MPITSKQMIRLLKRNGYKQISSNGSHIKMFKQENNSIIIVPFHNRVLSTGTEHQILKKAGLK